MFCECRWNSCWGETLVQKSLATPLLSVSSIILAWPQNMSGICLNAFGTCYKVLICAYKRIVFFQLRGLLGQMGMALVPCISGCILGETSSEQRLTLHIAMRLQDVHSTLSGGQHLFFSIIYPACGFSACCWHTRNREL